MGLLTGLQWSTDGFIEVMWLIYAVLLLLLLAPIFYFLNFGWHNRRKDVLNSFSEAAAVRYLQCFQRSQSIEQVRAVQKAEVEVSQDLIKLDALQAVVDAGYKRASALAKDGKDAEAAQAKAEAVAADGQARDAEGEARASVTQRAIAYQNALKAFEAYFDTQFGRRRFIVPIALLLLFAILLLFLCARSAIRWHLGDLNDGPLSLAVVLAILGGYTWVMYDLIDRTGHDDLRPVDLFRSSFRLLIAVPVGYAFGK